MSEGVGRGNKFLGTGNSAPREISGSARKMMERANAGLGEAILPHLFGTQPERDVHDRTPDRNVRTLDDVTRGLGLDRVDEMKIRAAIDSTRVSYDPRSNDRFLLGVQSFTEMMRRSFKHIQASTRRELSLRVRAYWRNNNATDYTKPVETRYRARGAMMGKSEQFLLMPDGRVVLRKASPIEKQSAGPQQQQGGGEKPPPGFMPIPRSKKGGYKSPDGKTYWYPDGKGVRGHAEEDQHADAQHGQPAPGAKPGPQAPGAAPKGPKGPPGAQGAPKGPKGAAGPQGATGGGAGEAGGDGHPAPKFSPAPDGAHPDEQINHHVQERSKHLAAKRKFLKKDPKRAAAHHEAANQHTRAANPLIKQKHKAGGGAGAEGGEGDEEGQTPPSGAQDGQGAPEGDDDGAGAPPMGASAPGAPGGAPGAMHPFDQETQQGLAQSPSGVRADANGNRMTAAKQRDRAVPESETVRKTREALGRSLNVMADLSSAHDHLGSLKSKLSMVKKGKDPETGGPLDPRLARRHVAMIQAEMAATKHDIVQLEDAHDHSMKELKQAQQGMVAERIESHPIFQAFIALMEKLGSFGDKLSGMVDPESERKTNEQKIAAQQNEGGAPDLGALDQKGDANASEADLADEGPTDVLGINKDEIDRMFGAADDGVKKQAMQAFDTLKKLAEKHGSHDGPADGEDEGASQFGAESTDDDNASDLIGQIGKDGPGEEGGEEQLAQPDKKGTDFGSIKDDDGSFDADIASAKSKRDTAERHASAGASMIEERTKGMSESQRMKFALGASDDDAPETRDGGDDKSTAASGVRPKKKRTPNDGDEKGTVATGAGKKRKTPPALVKSDAWGLAIGVGLRAMGELRTTQEILAPSQRFIVKAKPERRIPFFFNEL